MDYVKQQHDKPWLLWLCYNAPHMPLTVHPRHQALYHDTEVPSRPTFSVPGPASRSGSRRSRNGRRARMTFPAREPAPSGSNFALTIGWSSTVEQGIGRIRQAAGGNRTAGQHAHCVHVGPGVCLGAASASPGKSVRMMPACGCRSLFGFPAKSRRARSAVSRRPWWTWHRPSWPRRAQTPWPMADLRPLLANPQAEWNSPAVMEHFQWQFGPETDRGVTGKDAMGTIALVDLPAARASSRTTGEASARRSGSGGDTGCSAWVAAGR